VIAIDIDPDKIYLAKNNANVYNVYHKITFIVGDFFKIGHQLRDECADAIVTSPPWGGPSYYKKSSMSPKDILIDSIFAVGKTITKKILLHLPKNINEDEVCTLLFTLAKHFY